MKITEKSNTYRTLKGNYSIEAMMVKVNKSAAFKIAGEITGFVSYPLVAGKSWLALQKAISTEKTEKMLKLIRATS